MVSQLFNGPSAAAVADSATSHIDWQLEMPIVIGDIAADSACDALVALGVADGRGGTGNEKSHANFRHHRINRKCTWHPGSYRWLPSLKTRRTTMTDEQRRLRNLRRAGTRATEPTTRKRSVGSR